MVKKVERLNMVLPTDKYGDVVVVDYKDTHNVTVKFINTGTIVKTKWYHIKSGVKDYNQATLYGVGIYGKEKADTKTKSYKTWNRMLERCYKNLKNYELCTVSDNFKNFSYFENWRKTQVGCENISWHLDKDILVKGNKIYSEDTCCFVPQEINGLFTLNNISRGECFIGVTKNNRGYVAQMKNETIGVFGTELEAFLAYKEVKECKIKQVANKWKDQIDVRVYEALMNWSLDIND